MTHPFVYPVAAATLFAISVPTAEGIGFFSTPRLPTQVDITRLDSNMVNVSAYASQVTTRVCYSKVADVIDYVYTGNSYFYRVKACAVPNVLTPKCSGEQLAACTPSFYTIGIFEDYSNHTEIIRVDNDNTDQNETIVGNTSDAAATTTPTTVVPTPVLTANESASNDSAANNTEAGAVTAPTSAVPASSPKQSGAVPIGAGCAALASAVATLVAAFASL